MSSVNGEGDDKGKLLAYTRVSSSAQDLARQQAVVEQAQEDAQAQDDRPEREVVVIEDDGVSAFRVAIFDRPGGKRLCAMVEADEVEAIYTDALDRLTRGDELEWVMFRALCEAHGTRLVIDGRELRDDFAGRIEGYFKALLARQESVEKSHRVRAGKRTAAQRGRRNGGPRPYGYSQADGALTQVPDEVAVLRRIRAMVVDEGLSLSEIARRLNAAGVRTARGARWSQTRLSQTLRNPLYAGKVHHRGELLPGNHEPVFTDGEFEELRVVLESRQRGGGGRGGRPTAGSHVLIRRMLQCECGASMGPRRTSNSQGRHYELYVCLGRLSGSTDCTRPGIRRERVDGALEAYLGRCGLTDLEAARRAFEDRAERDLAHVKDLLAAARRKAAGLADSLDRIRADYKADRISAEKWVSLDAEIDAERAEAAAEVERFAAREQELVDEQAMGDSEAEALRYLSELRRALTEPICNAETLGALRLRLSQVFDHFVLREPRQLTDQAVGPAPVEAAGYWLQPVIREDAFDSLVAVRQPTVSRR